VVNKPSEKIMAGDKGRFIVTQAKKDEFFFKSPSLRNIELTPPYFHSGVVWDLKEAVSVMNDSQIGADLKEEDIRKIAVFLKATTGKQPEVIYPILPAPTSATLKPSLE
jgi:cytochrome c peroxidase